MGDGPKKFPEGSVPSEIVPIVFLTYRARKVKGSHPRANETITYVLHNELVQPWEVTLRIFNDRSVVTETITLSWGPHKRDAREKFFDDEKGFIVPQRIKGEQFNRIAEAHRRKLLTAFITLDVQYHRFFFKFLESLRSETSDQSTFGGHIKRRGKSDPKVELSAAHREILGTFESGKNYELKNKVLRLEELPCEIKNSKVIHSTGAVFVQLEVYIRAKEYLPADQVNDFATAMVAADWSALNGLKPRPAVKATRDHSKKTWSKNIEIYMLNYTRLERGKEILNKIIASGKEKAKKGVSAAEIFRHVRNEIDERLITANTWYSATEDRFQEEYQHELMRLLGSIFTKRRVAAPVELFRVTAKAFGYTTEQQVHFALQSGVGHCGEHAAVSFLVLKEISANGHFPTPVILSAEVEIDHAFVVAGLKPTSVIPVFISDKNNPHYEKKSDPLETDPDHETFIQKFAWNLEEALKKSPPGVEGHVCDPYLEKDLTTGPKLLKAIRKKGEPVIMFFEIAPEKDKERIPESASEVINIH